jgi:hypothetical protein
MSVNMKRRDFITLLGGAAAAWPMAARAQQAVGRTGKMPRVGMLMPGPAAHSAATLDPFYRGLHELGYIEGQNLAIERRDGDWKPDRLLALAAELVGLKVDIIVAWSTPTARAAKRSWPIPSATSWSPALRGRAGMSQGRPFSARSWSPSACSCSETSFPDSLAWLPSGIPTRTVSTRWQAS